MSNPSYKNRSRKGYILDADEECQTGALARRDANNNRSAWRRRTHDKDDDLDEKQVVNTGSRNSLLLLKGGRIIKGISQGDRRPWRRRTLRNNTLQRRTIWSNLETSRRRIHEGSGMMIMVTLQ